MSERPWVLPDGRTLHLRRAHADGRRAWEGADALLLESALPHLERGPVWIFGDHEGALATALPGPRLLVADLSWTERHTRSQAVGNPCEPGLDILALGPSTELASGAPAFDPLGRLDGTPGLVLIRQPRSAARLEAWLQALGPHLSSGTPVLVGARQDRLRRGSTALLEQRVGPCRASRGRYKARVLTAVATGPRPGLPPPPSAPVSLPDGSILQLAALPGTFAAGRLDHGARVLLEHGAAAPGPRRVLDLGCGSGALGVSAALAQPDRSVVLSDCDARSLAGAAVTARGAGVGDRCRLAWEDAGAAQPDAAFDRVLCNPPFHEGDALSLATAERMFAQAARVLAPHGDLLVVANRHLGHHRTLRRCFERVDVVSGDPRFVVLVASRPR